MTSRGICQGVGVSLRKAEQFFFDDKSAHRKKPGQHVVTKKFGSPGILRLRFLALVGLVLVGIESTSDGGTIKLLFNSLETLSFETLRKNANLPERCSNKKPALLVA